MVKKYTAWTHDIHELDGPRTDKHVLVMYADYAAIEARCGELERDRCVWANGEGLGAEYLKAQARIAALEAQLAECKIERQKFWEQAVAAVWCLPPETLAGDLQDRRKDVANITQLRNRVADAREMFLKLLHASIEEPVPIGFWDRVESWVADAQPGSHNVASTSETSPEPNYRFQEPSNLPSQSMTIGAHPGGGPCIHVWALTNRSAVENGKCELCGNSVPNRSVK